MTIRGFADFATQFLLFQAFPNAMRRLFAEIRISECVDITTTIHETS